MSGFQIPTMVKRYPAQSLIRTRLNPLTDAMLWMQSYCAKDFLSQTLVEKHGVSTLTEARIRHKQIYAHLQLAVDYLTQSQETARAEAAFLPAYYGILNLMKVVILTGALHDQLGQNRHHGITYPWEGGRQSPRRETLRFKQRGAFSLFYRTVTGSAVPQLKNGLVMDEIYPLLQPVEAEIHRAGLTRTALCEFTVMPSSTDEALECCIWQADSRHFKLRSILGKEYKRKGANFYSRRVPQRHEVDPEDQRLGVKTYLLYEIVHRGQIFTLMPRSGSVQFFEEVPIILLFFHLGSVARYNPEFLYRLSNSKYWPAFSSARTHALLRFMELFCSYMSRSSTHFVSA